MRRGEDPYGSVGTPIYRASTFRFPNDDPRTWDGEVPEGTFIYTRYSNPTVEVPERALADLEGADEGLLFASGMAAISTTLLSLLSKGDAVACMRDVYGGTASLMTTVLPRFGIDVRWLELMDDGTLEGDVDDVDVVFLESPTNPTLRILDVRKATRMAHDAGALAVVDNTFATPVNQRPIKMGADIVVHSATKYLNGHSDLIGGAVVGRRDLIERVSAGRRMFGGVMDPGAAYLLNRGMMTLGVRMLRHNENALAVARFLEAHPDVSRVHHPGLESHPQHALAKSTMDGFGGMLSFVVDGRERAEDLMRSLRVITMAPSLGGVESLVSMPRSTSHASLSRDQREAIGIPEGMVRLSVGIEPVEDIIDDLRTALGD